MGEGLPGWRTWMLRGSAVLFAALFLAGLNTASRWPFIADAPLMHYVVFLMSKGLAPYRDIVDMNMPGSYLMQGFAIQLFGSGAAGWFGWDMSLDLALVLGSAWIAGPSKRTAGVIAGLLACLMHLADGAWDMGQRDWGVAVLLLLAFACLFHFLRGGHAVWVACALLFGGLAATIKPPAILFSALAIALVCWWFRRAPQRMLSVVGWALAGVMLPVAMVLVFLLHWHVFGNFIAMVRGLLPYYAAQQRMSVPDMIWHTLSLRERLFGLVAAAGLVAALVSRAGYTLEQWLLIAGSGCGLVSYIVQAKGFTYHRYPAEVFLSLFSLLAIEKGLRGKGSRLAVAAAMMVVLWAVAGLSLQKERSTVSRTNDTVQQLGADLDRLGGARLSSHVQCLDMTWVGCVNTLHRMRLVQSTGSLYDFYLFPERSTPVTEALQARFMQEIAAHPPHVFVLGQQDWPSNELSYDKVSRWPAFKGFLAERYTLAKEQRRLPGELAGYRLYVERGYQAGLEK